MRLSNGIIPFSALALILAGCGGAGSPEASLVEKIPDLPIDGPVLKVGFGDRVFTPVGEPPEEWAQFFTPQAITGIWGEPFVDANGDGCYNNSSSGEGESEAHTDEAWNSDATGQAFNVREVYIYGDEQSGGKWDGIWAGAGFGSQCGEGVLDDVQARGFVAEYEDTTVAVFSIDTVGFFNYEMKRIRSEMAARYPEMEIDEFIISSTHTHEAMDTMGYWGEQIGVDGKFPAFQAYVRSQIIDAVHDAWLAREPAKARFATVADTVPIRDSRPPIVIDKNLEVVQFAALNSDRVLGTGVVYGNHPEAMGGDNGFLTSDYAHFIRVFLEEEFGGVGVLYTGSVGGLMTPLRVDYPGFGTAATYERTEEIGRLVTEEAIAGIKQAQYETVNTISHNRRDVYMEADSTLLVTLNNAGVFDMPTYNGGDTWGSDESAHTAGVESGESGGNQFLTELVSIQLNKAAFVSVPGELFPELEYGGYGRTDCEEHTPTGAPYEPTLRESWIDTGVADHLFVLGLGMDELGYIVPRYDHYFPRIPEDIASGDLEYTDECGEGHYEETVSGSSYLAPWTTCGLAELAGLNPWEGPDAHPACTRENTGATGQ